MRRSTTSGVASLVAGLALLGIAATSHATITVNADYRLGEADAGAVAGGSGDAVTADSSGNGLNLSQLGSTTYSADHGAPFSSLSMSFDGGGYYAGSTVTNNTQNFGIAAYVNPFDVASGQGLAINGSGCCSGFGLYLQDGMYYGLYGGVNGFAIGEAVAGTWAYIAVVNDGGVTRSFMNLVEGPSGYYGDPHPANAPVCCSPQLGMTIGSDGSHHFNGLIDRVTVFTFNPGEFNVSDLVPVPEPTSLALLSLGLMALGFARRRKV